MADTREEFIDDLISAHDELVDVAGELEQLLVTVPELGIEPVVVASVNAQVAEILDHVDEALSKAFALKSYVETFDAVVGDLGTEQAPAGDVNEVFAPGTTDVAQPPASDDNLINKPEPVAADANDGKSAEQLDFEAVAARQNDAQDETRAPLVDKEDAANSIPGPTQQEGVVIPQEDRFAPDQYPSTDKAGDISVTQKPEAEPVRPDADASDNQGDPQIKSQVDVTSPNDVVQSPDPTVSIPDAGQVRNDLKVPDAGQQGDAPETDSK